MSFENKYPYTDFHELNLDWFLKEFKNLVNEWAELAADNAEFKQTMTERFGTLSNTVQEFTTFVTNYFDNLDVQQEINNKLDALVADGTISSLLQPYFNELSSGIFNSLNNQNSRITTLESRMDSFSHLSEGSTTGDAELIDARIGYSGITYDNAGDAIRNQVSLLHDEFDEMAGYMSDPVDLGISPSTGFYRANTGGYDSSTLYRYILTQCTAGDVFIVNSTYGSNCHIANFYDDVPAGSSFVGIWGGQTSGVEVTATNEIITIPDGVSYVVFNSKANVTFNVAKRTFYQTGKEAEYNKIKTALTESVSPAVSWESGKLFNVNTKTEAAVTNGEYFKYDVPTNGSYFYKIKFSGHMFSSNNYKIISFWDENDDMISSFGTGSTTYTDEEIDIPDGTSYIIMNTNSNYTNDFNILGILLHSEDVTQGEIYYQLANNELYVSTRFNDTDDFVVLFRRKGGNNLPDFGYFYSNANTGMKPKPNLTGMTSFFSQGSDWHGPMIVRAVNNIDGDQTDSHYWTGGNHQYNNTGSGSTPTARCTDLKFYIDNAEITEGSGYCSEIKITWTNMIQAYNTAKSDGTGREVLKEMHQLYFDGTKWESRNEIIALEDVVFERYYGFQFGGTGSVWPNVRYIGAANRSLYNGNDGTSSGDKTCFMMMAYGTTHEIDLILDNQLDLGKREHYSGTKGMLTSTYGKAYTQVIGDMDDPDQLTNYPVYEDDMIALHGWYIFKPVR